MTERQPTASTPHGRVHRPGHRGSLQPIALESRSGEEALRTDEERLAALVAVQNAVAAADLDVHALLHLIVERVQQLTGASGATIALTEGNRFVYQAGSGAARAAGEARPQQEAGWLPEELSAGKLWRCDEPWFSSAEEGGAARPGAACSRLILPLCHREQVVGLLEILTPLAHAFHDREIHTLQLLEELLAAVLSHARDFETQRGLLDQRTTELHLSEERFESVFTGSAFGMACLAPSGQFLRANPALCKLLNRPEEELLRLDLPGLLHPDDRACCQGLLDRLLRGELHNYQLEQRFPADEDRTVWALVSVSLVRDRQGNPSSLIAQFQDVSTQKRLQERCEELQKMEALARLVSGLPPELRIDAPSPAPRPRRKRRRSASLEAEPQQPREWSFAGWYYKHGKTVVGPVAREELRRLVETGQLRDAERIWERWKLDRESFLMPTTARAACGS